MVRKKVRIKKPTKLEELTIATKQDHSHLHSESIRAKRDLLQFEADQVAERIVSFQSALAKARERGRTLQAQIVGLGLVLERR